MGGLVLVHVIDGPLLPLVLLDGIFPGPLALYFLILYFPIPEGTAPVKVPSVTIFFILVVGQLTDLEVMRQSLVLPSLRPML